MTQIEFYLPPPITAHDAAAILGRLGAIARNERARRPIRATTAQMRRELGLPQHPALET